MTCPFEIEKGILLKQNLKYSRILKAEKYRTMYAIDHLLKDRCQAFGNANYIESVFPQEDLLNKSFSGQERA